MSDTRRLLLIGASGVIGQAILARFSTLPGWDLLCLGRRRPPGCPPERFVQADLLDAHATREAIAAHSGISHVIYCAVWEKPGALIAGWQDPQQMTRNDAMLRNAMAALQGQPLEQITLFQGSKAYGSHLSEPVPVPAKERWPRHDHANFYWLQEDFIREAQARSGWNFTILRPRIVFGEAAGSNMNPITAIGAFAAICRYRGEPLYYPGGPLRLTQATDADLIAAACAWATTAATARNATFNIENGDVFSWQTVWPAIAEALEMEPGPARPQKLDSLLEDPDLWPKVVARFGLRAPPDLAAFTGQSLAYTDFQMATGRESAPPPVIVSGVALRQAGFHDCIDTEDMLQKWLRRLRRQSLLP